MNLIRLKGLRGRLYFGVDELASALKIRQESARVALSRYVKNGMLIRLKRNFYCFNEKWAILEKEELFKVANLLQVPSYISFMTALNIYELTTQVQRDFFESASLKRSLKFNLKGREFNYYKLKKGLYFDFVKKGEFFIATKEKAFLDACYLFSFGRYKLDFDSLDFHKLDKKRLISLLKAYPPKTINLVKKLCKI